jgi:agmatinase
VTLNLPDNFLALPEEWSDFDRSNAVILPLPYEHTTSYGTGTAAGPEAILDASHNLELYDEELDSEIFKLSNGIATLEPLDFSGIDETAVEEIRKKVKDLIIRGKTVVCVGGEHTIAVGAARAYTEEIPELSILQLDAHSDLRDEYEGNRYSHASVMARIFEFNQNIVQLGIRSQCAVEADFIRKHQVKTFFDYGISQGIYGGDWKEAVISSLKENVYITIDCDFFDPALMPAVGTPEPGGPGWHETMSFLRLLSQRRRIAGFDVNELSPIPGLVHPQFMAAKLIYKLIGYVFARNR